MDSRDYENKRGEQHSHNHPLAKTQDNDKVLGLNLGADDYVAKPFNPLELIARVKSQIRRYTNFGTIKDEPEEKVYSTGGLVINDDRKEVTVDGRTGEAYKDRIQYPSLSGPE